jgi:hypothetical protein
MEAKTMHSNDTYDEGLYKAKARSWGFYETTNGFDQFFMNFEIVGRMNQNDLNADPQPCPAGIGTWSITINSDDNAAWLVSTVQRLGYDGNDLLSLDPSMPHSFDFENREFLVVCRHEEFRDQVRAKWSVYRPSTVKPLAKERLLSLNDRYGHLVPEIKTRRAIKETEAMEKLGHEVTAPLQRMRVPTENSAKADSPAASDGRS